MLQLALKVDDSSQIDELANQIIDRSLGFRVCSANDQIISIPTKREIHSIPKNIKTLAEASDWVVSNHTPAVDDSLASIAAKDDMIVLNTNHLCADGARLVSILHSLGQDFPGFNEKLPLSSFTLLEKEIKEAKFIPPRTTHDINGLRYLPREKPNGSNHTAGSIDFRIPLEKLPSYNPITRHCSKVTESVWASMLLAKAAFNGEVNANGIATLMDIRRISTDMWHLGNHNSSITAYAGKIDMNETLETITARMRANMNAQLSQGVAFGFLALIKEIMEGPPFNEKAPPGLGCQMSSVGLLAPKDPISDVRVSLTAAGGGSAKDLARVMTYTVQSSKSSYFSGQLQYDSALLTKKEAKELTSYLETSIASFPLSMKFGEAVSKLKQRDL